MNADERRSSICFSIQSAFICVYLRFPVNEPYLRHTSLNRYTDAPGLSSMIRTLAVY